MNDSSQIFVLSPHIDDAAFGLALTICKFAAGNIPVTVLNCFTVTKWTAIPVENKEIAAVSRLRKDEDFKFYAGVNAKIKIINLDLLDAPLRNGYIFQNQPFQQNELELIENLKELIEQNVSNGILLCPLAIGNHIDHAICREAVISLYEKINVIFFEDLPYAQRIGEDQIHRHIRDLADQLEIRLVPQTIAGENLTIDKEQAIEVYKSQVNKEIVSEIVAHMEALNGERLWGEEENVHKLLSLSSGSK